jgi:hypothetical protein
MFGLACDRDWLSIAADVAEAVTGVVAGWAGIRFLWRKRRRRLALENHLEAILAADQKHGKNGRRTPLRLSADLGFTVEEIQEAAFSSNKIERTPHINPKTKRATAIFLGFKNSN